MYHEKSSDDRWGNRTAMWDAVSGGNQIQSLVLQQSGGAPTNRLTSVPTSGVTANYSYDTAGNVTNDGSHTYTYDAENRIVSSDSGATATYAYDTSNQRNKKVTAGATTHYVWQGSQVIAEHNGSTGASIADYIYADSRMVAKASGLSTQYSLSDRLSARMTLNSIGNVLGRQAHLPFGEDFAETGTQEKHHFTSYERDVETGIDYAVNRKYAQTVGRFIRVDPVRGSCSNPQSLNRYAYVRNDPANLVDPSGREAVDPYGLGCTLGNCASNVSAGLSTIDAGAAGSAAAVMEYWRTHPRLTDGEPRRGDRGGANLCTVTGSSGNGDDSESDPGGTDERVYRCTRPLGKPGSTKPCTGALCHRYLCAGKPGNIECVGLNNSGFPLFGSPGINNPADGYNERNCTLVSFNPCMVECVKRKFKEPLPWWDFGPTGTDCHEWVDDTLSACRGDCK